MENQVEECIPTYRLPHLHLPPSNLQAVPNETPKRNWDQSQQISTNEKKSLL
jgi:hypothetical protein